MVMRKMATGVLIGLSAIGGAQGQTSPDPADDYRWLEEIGAEKSLANARSAFIAARCSCATARGC
jgi:hypothetical protein